MDWDSSTGKDDLRATASAAARRVGKKVWRRGARSGVARRYVSLPFADEMPFGGRCRVG